MIPSKIHISSLFNKLLLFYLLGIIFLSSNYLESKPKPKFKISVKKGYYLIWNKPFIKKMSRDIVKNSNGENKLGMYINDTATLKHPYHFYTLCEYSEFATSTIADFLVNVKTGKILVYDIPLNEYISVSRWLKERRN